MKISVVLNLSAGGLIGRPPDVATGEIVGVFEAAGATVRMAAVEPKRCVAAITDAARSDADVVVVGGGDGTIATAVNLLMPTGKALGILPLGTMNLLARDLSTPLDLGAAARALAEGEFRRIDVSDVNGEIFLNNSVLGFYPNVVLERERQRGQHHLRKWPAMALAMGKAMYHFPILDVAVDPGTGPWRVKTPILAVSNDPYDEGYGPILRRGRLDQGTLGIYIAHHRDVWGFLRLVWRMGLGTWAEDGELDRFTAPTLTVHSRHRRLRVANDGEVLRMRPPLVYRIRPQALRVLAPKGEQAS